MPLEISQFFRLVPVVLPMLPEIERALATAQRIVADPDVRAALATAQKLAAALEQLDEQQAVHAGATGSAGAGGTSGIVG